MRMPRIQKCCPKTWTNSVWQQKVGMSQRCSSLARPSCKAGMGKRPTKRREPNGYSLLQNRDIAMHRAQWGRCSSLVWACRRTKSRPTNGWSKQLIQELAPRQFSYNVEVTLAMWVSIQDLKKPLNTEFSIGPKSVTIVIPGCQYKNSVPKLRPFFQITNNYQNYHYIYIYI